MGRMHWIIGTLALGSLVLGSIALGSMALGSLAVGGSALAGAGAGGEIGIGFTFAPGQQGTSPGKVFDSARASEPAPGKLRADLLAASTRSRSLGAKHEIHAAR